jgi:hypothetical protein
MPNYYPAVCSTQERPIRRVKARLQQLVFAPTLDGADDLGGEIPGCVNRLNRYMSGACALATQPDGACWVAGNKQRHRRKRAGPAGRNRQPNSPKPVVIASSSG